MISLNRLSYAFPRKSEPALEDITWEVQPGEFVLVAGPSGSGKSTLLRCLNGLVPHFTGGAISGTIEINGLDGVKAGPHVLSREVGFVLQNPEAQAVLDQVEPEIAFGMENAAIPPQEMRVRMEEVLSLLDLTAVRERALNTLSGGERQRVAIASALVLRPQILVLDEPTSQLDPQSAEEVLRALVRLNEDLGLTIILAEHRLERVLRYVDRIAYLENGRLLVDDDTRAAVTRLPLLPPLVQLGRELQWQPIPLTVKEGRHFARRHWASNGNGSNGTRPRRKAAPQPSLLSVKGLSFAYNEQPTLNNISLEVKPGETVALMGRNGAGKSTLLKCMLGLLSPQQGNIEIDGRATTGRTVADICREAAYLPQNPDDLLFAESVNEELTTTLRNHRLPERDGVAGMLAQLGLTDVAEAYPRDLSVGQRQRVALGAVTITHPRLLLLDEPTRGLDYMAKQALLTIWRKWLDAGMGLLLVTHDVELVAQIADRVLIMSQGEIIAAGETGDVLGTSPLFAPQISRLFPQSGWLTVADVLGEQPLV